MRNINILLSIVILALIPMQVFSATDEASKHFEKGRRLISDNCYECSGATRKGLNDGLFELELAEKMGYVDKAAIYKSLFDAYGDIAFVFGESEEEKSKYKEMRHKIAEKLAVLLPDDSESVYWYAAEVKDKDEQLKLMQKVISLDPKNFRARLRVGLRFIEIGKIDQAMVELKRTVSDADINTADWYREVVIEKLEEFGYKNEVAEFIRQFPRKTPSKNTPSGVPKELGAN